MCLFESSCTIDGLSTFSFFLFILFRLKTLGFLFFFFFFFIIWFMPIDNWISHSGTYLNSHTLHTTMNDRNDQRDNHIFKWIFKCFMTKWHFIFVFQSFQPKWHKQQFKVIFHMHFHTTLKCALFNCSSFLKLDYVPRVYSKILCLSWWYFFTYLIFSGLISSNEFARHFAGIQSICNDWSIVRFNTEHIVTSNNNNNNRI